MIMLLLWIVTALGAVVGVWSAVLGMKERGGRMQARLSGQMTFDEIHGSIHESIEPGSQLYTDDSAIFDGLDGLFYRHDSINHSRGEYARGAAHTNSIESVWAVLKRGLMGVYHHASPKHLPRYVDEFTVPPERRERQGSHARPARLVRRRHGRQASDLQGTDSMSTYVKMEHWN